MNDDTKQSAISQLFEHQRAMRWEVAHSSAAQRIEKLKRLKQTIVERRQEVAQAMKADFGKASAEVEITEIHPVLEELNEAIKNLTRWMKPQKKTTPALLIGSRSFVQFEPRGVVLILSPWNYPFALTMTPLVAALAAGNCVMLRPSDKTAHTAACMKNMLDEVFPANEVAMVTGGTEVADALLQLPFDHIFFTGSPRIGKKIMESAAKHLASVTLELGGKSPAIVDETADIEQAARRLAWGKYVNAGQTCVAPDHIWAHHTVLPRLVVGLQSAIAEMYGATEEARANSPDFARIVDTAGAKRLQSLLEGAVHDGARIETGGVIDIAKRYVAPTVLSGVTLQMAVMQDEIFGPLLPILSFRELKEVSSTINKGSKPLAMYIFGAQPVVDHFLSNTSAGGTVVGNALIHVANPHLPFGGVGGSGQGNYHGHYGFRTFSHERAVAMQGSTNLAKFFRPPYGEQLTRTLVAQMKRFQ